MFWLNEVAPLNMLDVSVTVEGRVVGKEVREVAPEKAEAKLIQPSDQFVTEVS